MPQHDIRWVRCRVSAPIDVTKPRCFRFPRAFVEPAASAARHRASVPLRAPTPFPPGGEGDGHPGRQHHSGLRGQVPRRPEQPCGYGRSFAHAFPHRRAAICGGVGSGRWVGSSAMRGCALCRLQCQGLVVARAHRPVARRQGPRLAGPRRFVPLTGFCERRFPLGCFGPLCRSDSGRAGKVRGQTPKVAKQDKKKHKTGRAKRRIQYNRRFVNVVAGAGKKKGPNCNNVA